MAIIIRQPAKTVTDNRLVLAKRELIKMFIKVGYSPCQAKLAMERITEKEEYVHRGGGILSPFPCNSIYQMLKKEFFINTPIGFYIEAGACDGVSGSICKLFENDGWHGINIEANEFFIKALSENRPNDINIHAALSDKNGTAILTIPQYKEGFVLPGGSSLTYWNNRNEPGVPFKFNVEVQTITYHKMCSDNKITNIDLFVLDVEGEELRVIDSIEQGDPLPRVFYIEDNKIDKELLKTKMLKLGYQYRRANSSNMLFWLG